MGLLDLNMQGVGAFGDSSHTNEAVDLHHSTLTKRGLPKRSKQEKEDLWHVSRISLHGGHGGHE